MTKVLFLAHYFPPLGGAGVQRSAKFVKHLPACGVLPLVLTGPGKEQSRWTPEDASLLADIPAGVPVHRAEYPANDPVARRASLLALGDRLIREHRPALIFVTMSPFGDAAIAAELARRHGLPWVADLRDPWALDEFQVHRTAWHRWRLRRRMASALASATSIILNTPEARQQFHAAFPALAGRARVAITNGYDAEEFPATGAAPRQERFTIVHSGYLHTTAGLHQRAHAWQYRLLGRLEPGVVILPRSHFYLLRALEAWLRQEPGIAARVRVELVGVPALADEQLVRESPAGRLCTFTGYLPHAECVRRVRAADLLFLPLHRLPPGRRSSIVPGKTYEYLATRRPILAAVPEGDARDFLAAAGTARLAAPDDEREILAGLQAAFRDWEQGVDVSARWQPAAVERFERQNLTRQLADELAAVLAAARPRPAV